MALDSSSGMLRNSTRSATSREEAPAQQEEQHVRMTVLARVDTVGPAGNVEGTDGLRGGGPRPRARKGDQRRTGPLRRRSKGDPLTEWCERKVVRPGIVD
ncbi:hypothetical protein FOMPIDRAFT_1050370 [Fomitopsis schrenkii]|uniref:Uncharacterized protein n=1 Tax=Fomitopsis schrenkii TaxID=2126942 RepID=S8E907_FOMSC|nr:hypothetical protein FOMPIDRAFT_1050370 [Fomitopsis schrenkii]